MKAMRVAATLLCGACLIVPLSRAPVSGDPPSNWAWAIGGAGTENLSVLEPTSDGGWILGGETLGFGAKNQDIWVVKLGTDGKVQWQKRYGGNANEYIGGPGSVCQAPDGGFLIAATTYTFGAGRSDGWILRIDSFGSVLWQKTLGGPGWEHFFGLDLNADGTWIITGNTELFGGKDVWLVKIDDTGRVLWQRAYKAAGHYTNGWVVRCTHDGSYFVMGEAYRLMADGYFWEDGLCMLVDPSGNLRWQRQITAGDYVDDVVTDAIQVRDGGFVCAGWSFPPSRSYYGVDI